MGDYTPVPDQSADQITTATSSADPVIPADSTSQPVQANSPPVVLPTQTDLQIPADSSAVASSKMDSNLEATASASSGIQSPASIAPTEVISSQEALVSAPVFQQPEVVPEQVFEASAPVTVSPLESTPVASDAFVENPQPNPPENSPVQSQQNTPEIPIVSVDQSPQETASQPVVQAISQPVEVTEQPSINEPSPVNLPIHAQQDAPTNTPSVSSVSIDQTQQESAEIKPEPLQPVQNTQINGTDNPKSSFGDLMGDKTTPIEEPSIHIDPIEAPPVSPSVPNLPNTPNIPNSSDDFAIRRQHAIEARKQKYANHLDSIIELVQKKGKVDNLDVRDFLHVSQTTATDYLHTLVTSGKLKKDGKAKATIYSLP